MSEENSPERNNSKDIVESLNEMAEIIEENTGRTPPEDHWVLFGDNIVDWLLEQEYIDPIPDEEFAGRLNKEGQEAMVEALLESDEPIPQSGSSWSPLPALPPVGTKVYKAPYLDSEVRDEATVLMQKESELPNLNEPFDMDNYL